jgi:hypothetical protein
LSAGPHESVSVVYSDDYDAESRVAIVGPAQPAESATAEVRNIEAPAAEVVRIRFRYTIPFLGDFSDRLLTLETLAR